MNFLRFLTSFFRWFGKQNDKFNEICYEGNRSKSMHFGINAILYLLIGFTLSALGIFAGIWMVSLGAGGTGGFFGVLFSVIFGIILIVVGGLTTLAMFIYSLTCSVLQLKMNRRIIGFFSLVLCFAVTAGAIYLGITILDNM